MKYAFCRILAQSPFSYTAPGTVLTRMNNRSTADAVALQSNGQILVGGGLTGSADGLTPVLFGLARLGHTDSQGMANLLQLALVAREFSDVMVFRSPPLVVQRALFGVLAPIARWRGYRATYPQLSRTVLAARTQASSLQFKMCNGSDLALLGLGQLCGTVTAIS